MLLTIAICANARVSRWLAKKIIVVWYRKDFVLMGVGGGGSSVKTLVIWYT